MVVQDRSQLFRDSLQLLLEAATFRVIDVVTTGEPLVDACRRYHPASVLFEAASVPWDVRAMVKELQKESGTTNLVGTYPHEYRHHQSIEGVQMVRRSSSTQLLVRALRGSLDGNDLVTAHRATSLTTSEERLTRREFQVLALISGGLTTAQIASRLGLSTKTIENRRQSLFVKLGVQNQSAAVAAAIRIGLLGPSAARRSDDA